LDDGDALALQRKRDDAVQSLGGDRLGVGKAAYDDAETASERELDRLGDVSRTARLGLVVSCDDVGDCYIGFADSPGLAVPRRFCKRELGSDFVKILAGLRERIAIHPNAISGANAVNKCATDKRDATDKTNRATDSILIGIGANAGFVFDESRSLTGLDCGAFHHFGIVADVHALSFPLSLELVNGFFSLGPLFFVARIAALSMSRLSRCRAVASRVCCNSIRANGSAAWSLIASPAASPARTAAFRSARMSARVVTASCPP
jgi:hypothetical protein